MPVQPFDSAQGSRPAAGFPPADIPSQEPPSLPRRLMGFINIPKVPLFPGLGTILFLCCAVVVVIVSTFFLGLPKLFEGRQWLTGQKQLAEFVAPIDVIAVEYPQGVVYEKFLENFQLAAAEGDYQKRYTYLEENFSILLGFYASSHDPKIRSQLEAYSAYMQSNFGSEYKKNADLYTVPCWDSGCGKVNYPAEIQDVKGLIEANAAFEDSEKGSLVRQLEVAGFSIDEASQWSAYVNVLSAIKSNYDVSKNESVLAIYNKLADFINKNYTDYKIPPQIVIEK